jgi:4-hydroxybenzoate-CoA ligase
MTADVPQAYRQGPAGDGVGAEVMNTDNAAEALIAPNLAAGRAAKPAFIDPFETLTYGGLAERVDRVANMLRTYGVPREARLAVLMLDTVDWPVVFLGAMKAGVVPVALNTLMSTEHYGYMLADSRAQALVVSAQLVPAIQPLLGRLPYLKHVFVSGGEAPTFALSLREEMAQQPATAAVADTVADEVAFWLYSSGSTGNPKGTKHVHGSLMATVATYGRHVLSLSEQDVVYSAAKLFFAYGLGNALTFPMAVGATTILVPERPTPEAVFRVFKERSPTVFFGVPTLYAAMLASPFVADRTTHSTRLRLCISAGEALPVDVGRGVMTAFGVDILDGIGSTEMLHIFLSNRPGEVKLGTTGKAVPGYRLRVVDEDNRDVADGEIGELLIAGPSAAEGYWNQRAKSQKTFEGAWCRSGDKYVRDAEGFYTCQGRTDDMFKVSGIWVSPFEVEAAILAHEAVLEAAVVPHEDVDGLVKPKAFIALKPGRTADGTLVAAVQDLVKAKAGPWKYPRWIEVMDALPKTVTGKIQRFKLRGGA